MQGGLLSALSACASHYVASMQSICNRLWLTEQYIDLHSVNVQCSVYVRLKRTGIISRTEGASAFYIHAKDNSYLCW